MKPSNSRIPTLNLNVDAERVSPLPINKPQKTIDFTIQRDVEAISIPDGNITCLHKGTKGKVTQALGSSYTVGVQGRLFRIDGEQGDAIEQPKRGLLSEELAQKDLTEDSVRAVLKTCFDPEIPVNLLDLGLIYQIRVQTNSVEIDMTLTAPGCGMGEVLVQELTHKLKKIRSVKQVKVNLVFDPPWDRSMISTAGQLELGLL